MRFVEDFPVIVAVMYCSEIYCELVKFECSEVTFEIANEIAVQ